MRWEDPEPGRSSYQKARRWGPVAEELKKHPNEWAVIDEGVTNHQLSVYVRNGRSSAFSPPGAFESRSRSMGDGTYKIYARYVGTP